MHIFTVSENNLALNGMPLFLQKKEHKIKKRGNSYVISRKAVLQDTEGDKAIPF